MAERGIPTRTFHYSGFGLVDVEDSLDRMICDDDFMSDVYNVSLNARFNKYSVWIEFHDPKDPLLELQLPDLHIIAVKKLKTKNRHFFLKAARFHPTDSDCLQKLYEFIIAEH